MIKDILLLQKRELEEKLNEKYIERQIVLKKFENELIKVIIGPRRAGKSFLGFHILKKLGNFGYINFDDERLTEIKNYDEIISTLNLIYRSPKNLLLDEIQNLPKWELFVNRLQRQKYNLIITGSNSKLLSKEFSTYLTGRHIPIVVLPFSFSEFLKTKEKDLTETETKTELINYITYGGYPEPIIKKIDIKDYLTVLFDSIIYKDIVKRYNIRLVSAIEDIAYYLISNIAKEFSYNSLVKIAKCKSVHTVEKYLNYLEEAFIFFKVPRFSYKLKQQILENKKIYCIDNGFIYAKAFKFSQDIGRLCENLVAVRLKKLEMEGKIKLYYWKNPQQQEVDFVIKEGLKITNLIQVCVDISDIKTLEREKRNLLKASEELNCKNLIILTLDTEKEEIFKWFGIKRKIKFIPLHKWIL